MAERYDLLVVGTGTGLDIANWAVGHGWRVALVEKGPAGGTCLNRGCIPSKMLIHVADVARTIQRAGKLGLRPRGFDVDFAAIMQRVRAHVDGDSARIDAALAAGSNPRYVRGEARFVGPRRLRVGEEEIVADRVVLATGARPRIPDVPGLREVPYLTSTEALDFARLPESMIILGGGYIAAELGHFYGALGTRVSVLHRHARLLPREDEDVGEVFTRRFAQDHDVRLQTEAVRVARDGEGVLVEAEHKPSGRRETLRAQTLLVATGVVPNSDTLDLAAGGVATDARGHIRADLSLATSAPGVWALGDAVGRFLFKHNANHEARYLIHNLQNPGAPMEVNYHAMPHAVFSDPQVAGVGATEQELRLAATPYRIARYPYAHTAMGAALMEEDGFVKFLVATGDDRILGCHIVGPEASTLLHEVLVGMTSGSNTLADLVETIHIHPALSEVVQRAAASVEPAYRHAP